MLKVKYMHKLEKDRNEEFIFISKEILKKHIQTEIAEFIGEDDIDAKDIKVIEKNNILFTEQFGDYHSWKIIGEV